MPFIHLMRVLHFTVAVLALTPSAHAFDPFTVLAAGSAAASLAEFASGGAQAAGEAGELFSALGELNNEILPADSDVDSYRIARKIAAIEQAARDAGYTKEEIDTILQDARESNQNLARSIRILSRSIRLGKRVAVMTGFGTVLSPKDKAGQAASVTAMQGQDQEKKILSDIYGEMVRRDLDSKKTLIEQHKATQKEYSRLRSFVLSVAPGGNLALFPIDSSIVKKAIDVYNAYAWVLLVLVGAIFMSRVVYYQMSFAPAEKYMDLFRDTFACYFLMLAFPYVYTYMADCSDALALKLGEVLHVTGAPPPERLSLGETLLPWFMRPEFLQLLLYAATCVVFNLIISLLISLGPVIVLMGTMMNFSVSLPAYFVLLLFVWLWPTFWNVLGYFKGVLWSGKGFSLDGIGSLIASGVMLLFQLFSPFAIYSMLKGTHGGQSASRLVGEVKKRTENLLGNNAAKKFGAGAAVGAGVGGSVGAASAAGVSRVAATGLKGVLSSPITSGKLFLARQRLERAGVRIGGRQYHD